MCFQFRFVFRSHRHFTSRTILQTNSHLEIRPGAAVCYAWVPPLIGCVHVINLILIQTSRPKPQIKQTMTTNYKNKTSQTIWRKISHLEIRPGAAVCHAWVPPLIGCVHVINLNLIWMKRDNVIDRLHFLS